jgi:hypothetical protein
MDKTKLEIWRNLIKIYIKINARYIDFNEDNTKMEKMMCFFLEILVFSAKKLAKKNYLH